MQSVDPFHNVDWLSGDISTEGVQGLPDPWSTPVTGNVFSPHNPSPSTPSSPDGPLSPDGGEGGGKGDGTEGGEADTDTDSDTDASPDGTEDPGDKPDWLEGILDFLGVIFGSGPGTPPRLPGPAVPGLPPMPPVFLPPQLLNPGVPVPNPDRPARPTQPGPGVSIPPFKTRYPEGIWTGNRRCPPSDSVSWRICEYECFRAGKVLVFSYYRPNAAGKCILGCVCNDHGSELPDSGFVPFFLT